MLFENLIADWNWECKECGS